jgi:membrane protein required for colicin V production
MSINWLDVLLGAVLLISFLGAVRNGLTKEIVRLIALVAGIVGGMWWYSDAAAYFMPYLADERISGFAGFLAILLGSLVAGMIVAWVLVKVLGWVGLRWFDRLLGGAFGLVRGLLVSAALVLALLAFSPLTRSAEVVAESRIAPWVLHTAQAASLAAPAELRRAYDEGFEKVKAAWLAQLSTPASQTGAGASPGPDKESPVRASSSASR